MTQVPRPVQTPSGGPVVATPPEKPAAASVDGQACRCTATVIDPMATQGRALWCELPARHVGKHHATIPQPGALVGAHIDWFDPIPAQAMCEPEPLLRSERNEYTRLWNAVADALIHYSDGDEPPRFFDCDQAAAQVWRTLHPDSEFGRADNNEGPSE